MEKLVDYTAERQGTSPKEIAGVIVAVIIVVASVLLPGSEDMTHEGIMAFGVLLACVALWFCESLPVGVVGVLGCVLLFALGVVGTLPEAFTGFTQSTVWFIFGIFVLTALMMNSTLGQRLIRSLVRRAGTDSRRIVLAFMLASWIVSMFMTDTGAVVITMSLALPLLDQVKAQPGKSNLGKCLMLGIAFAAVLGGFSTPFGHSLNILNLGILEQNTGLTVNFVQWVAVGVPVALVMLPVCWQGIVRAFPPEAITRADADAILGEGGHGEYGPWSLRDKEVLVLIVLVIAGFVAGNWVSALNSTVVILVALIIAFLPGLKLITWEQFKEIEGWNVVLMIGGVMSMGAAVSSTGGGAWLANLFLNSGILNLNVLAALLLMTAIMYIIHTVCPIAPALCALFLPPLIAYSQSVGISPAIMSMVMASITAGSFLLPLNPTIVVTFDKGYYQFFEVAKAGWLSAICYVVLAVCWAYFIGGMVLPA